MEVQIISSDKVREKLVRASKSKNITISDSAKVALVERGFPQPENKILLLFDPIDYDEVLDILNGNPEVSNKTITGFHNNRFSIINFQDIYFIESDSAKVVCETRSKRYQVKGTLNFYETAFKSSGLFRANKSQLVNLLCVKEIIPWFNSRLVLSLKNDVEIEVSKKYSKSLRSLLNM